MSIIYVDDLTYNRMHDKEINYGLSNGMTLKAAKDRADYLMRDWRRMNDTAELQKDLDDDKEGLTQ